MNSNSISDPKSPEENSISRKAVYKRKTKETEIEICINLDGTKVIDVRSGVGFLDHLLATLGFHASWDLELSCKGDIGVDDHHSVEDCALSLGVAIDRALGDRLGITRFGFAYAPLDEALARAVVDLSGRSWSEVHLCLERSAIGALASENITHFIHSLTSTLRGAIHVDVLRGGNDHHRAEAGFKALALALKQACKRPGEHLLAAATQGIPSTKGIL